MLVDSSEGPLLFTGKYRMARSTQVFVVSSIIHFFAPRFSKARVSEAMLERLELHNEELEEHCNRLLCINLSS